MPKKPKFRLKVKKYGSRFGPGGWWYATVYQPARKKKLATIVWEDNYPTQDAALIVGLFILANKYLEVDRG